VGDLVELRQGGRSGRWPGDGPSGPVVSVAGRQEGRRNGGEPGCIADVPVWMVLVKAGEGPLEGGDALDRLFEAVGAQAATLGASVAGGDEPSVLVSVEATDVAAAREAAAGSWVPRSNGSVAPAWRRR
jgi:hypothetical protein